MHKYNHREFAFVQNYQKWEKWIKGKIINSWWALIINRCDGIIYQRHVNQLRHNRKVSHEKAEKGEEMGHNTMIGMKGLIETCCLALMKI